MHKPLVSIICMCYNQEQYVEDAIVSVLDQEYDNIELIVLDDASTDNSREVIGRLAGQHHFKTIFNLHNLGNCSSFNLAFDMSQGDFIIDLAADDMILPERVHKGVKVFSQFPDNTGVHFCNVARIDCDGNLLGHHYSDKEIRNHHELIPQGDVYQALLRKHYISAPSMMFRRSVIEKLNGYDGDLSYEDFDFWIRSSRYFKYAFSPEVLVKKRIVTHSLSATRFKKKNSHILSTALVCEKALAINRSEDENEALAARCLYEIKWALAMEHWKAAKIFLKILKRLHRKKLMYWLGRISVRIRPPLFWFYILYSKSGLMKEPGG